MKVLLRNKYTMEREAKTKKALEKKARVGVPTKAQADQKLLREISSTMKTIAQAKSIWKTSEYLFKKSINRFI